MKSTKICQVPRYDRHVKLYKKLGSLTDNFEANQKQIT